jgi:hypothetical protein
MTHHGKEVGMEYDSYYGLSKPIDFSKFRLVLIFIMGLLWFPHSLERVKSLGYDFPIYLSKGKGWLYGDWVGWIFEPFRWLQFDYAFLLWYSVLVLCWILIISKTQEFRVGWVLWLCSFYPILLCLELGQITPLLAWLCLSPVGSVIAGFVKPYLFVFSIIWVVVYRRRIVDWFRNVMEKSKLNLFGNNLHNL